MTHDDRWRFRRWYWVVLALAFAVRAWHGARTPRPAALYLDGHEYTAYARSLLAGTWDDYPRCYNIVRPPLYPLVLVPCVAADPDGVRLIQWLQALFGTLLVPVLAGIAGRWAGPKAGDRALVLAAFHPFLVYYGAFVVTEPLFLLLLWAALAACLHVELDPARSTRWVVLAGILFGLGCLCRPALQPFLVPAALWVGWRVRRARGRRAALLAMALLTAVVSALLVPWMVRNRLVHGEASLAPRNAQQVFSQGNSEAYLRVLEAGSQEEFYARHDEMSVPYLADGGVPPDQWAPIATRFIRERPADWMRLQWKKTLRFWTPWLDPVVHPATHVWLSLGATLPLFVFSAAELLRRRGRPDAFGKLLAALVLVGWLTGGFLFHVAVRYRIPFVDVTFLVLTASWLGRPGRPPRGTARAA